MSLILASGSPQRRAILQQLGVPFTVVVSGAPELTAGPPHELVAENAYRKAAAVAGQAEHAQATVLGVDTIVALRERIFGKPESEREARETLQLLSGRRHTVLSGICLIEGGRQRTAVAATSVDFRPIDRPLLDWYLASGEWGGRAGGYAIQGRGAALVAGIEGDYLNVVGLPVTTLLELAPALLQMSD
ncbi:MAG TPA: Maf family protein [Solirubrobacteraceae bacterium]|nr:Maf family protein [Solirubrobacteraceae bacterium]